MQPISHQAEARGTPVRQHQQLPAMHRPLLTCDAINAERKHLAWEGLILVIDKPCRGDRSAHRRMSPVVHEVMQGLCRHRLTDIPSEARQLALQSYHVRG